MSAKITGSGLLETRALQRRDFSWISLRAEPRVVCYVPPKTLISNSEGFKDCLAYRKKENNCKVRRTLNLRFMCCINNNGKPERDQGFKTWTYYVCVWSVECGKLRATIFLSRFSQTKWNAVRLMCLGCILDLYPYSKLRVNWIYCAHTDHLLSAHTLDPTASQMQEIHCPYTTEQIWPCAMEVSANGFDLLIRWLNLGFS